MSVRLYTTPSCPYCAMARDYFRSRGISYEDLDITANRKAALEMIRKTRSQSVPTIEINYDVLVGFNPVQIDRVLAKELSAAELTTI